MTASAEHYHDLTNVRRLWTDFSPLGLVAEDSLSTMLQLMMGWTLPTWWVGDLVLCPCGPSLFEQMLNSGTEDSIKS